MSTFCFLAPLNVIFLVIFILSLILPCLFLILWKYIPRRFLLWQAGHIKRVQCYSEHCGILIRIYAPRTCTTLRYYRIVWCCFPLSFSLSLSSSSLLSYPIPYRLYLLLYAPCAPHAVFLCSFIFQIFLPPFNCSCIVLFYYHSHLTFLQWATFFSFLC